MSEGICRYCAFSTEHSTTAAAWSTMLFEFISFGYGQLIIRLPADGCAISSALTASRTQACGLAAATALKPAHNSPMRRWWSSSDSPAAIRSACSKSG